MSGVTSIVLLVHMFVTIALIGVVLLQRSEGGALGIGGGSGSFLSAASAGNALTRATMFLAAIFFATSILLAVLSRNPNRELDLQNRPAKGGLSAPQPAGTGAPSPAPQSGGPVSGSQSAPGQSDAVAPPAPAPSQMNLPAEAGQPSAPPPASPPKP